MPPLSETDYSKLLKKFNISIKATVEEIQGSFESQKEKLTKSIRTYENLEKLEQNKRSNSNSISNTYSDSKCNNQKDLQTLTQEYITLLKVKLGISLDKSDEDILSELNKQSDFDTVLLDKDIIKGLNLLTELLTPQSTENNVLSTPAANVPISPVANTSPPTQSGVSTHTLDGLKKQHSDIAAELLKQYFDNTRDSNLVKKLEELELRSTLNLQSANEAKNPEDIDKVSKEYHSINDAKINLQLNATPNKSTSSTAKPLDVEKNTQVPIDTDITKSKAQLTEKLDLIDVMLNIDTVLECEKVALNRFRDDLKKLLKTSNINAQSYKYDSDELINQIDCHPAYTKHSKTAQSYISSENPLHQCAGAPFDNSHNSPPSRSAPSQLNNNKLNNTNPSSNIKDNNTSTKSYKNLNNRVGDKVGLNTSDKAKHSNPTIPTNETIQKILDKHKPMWRCDVVSGSANDHNSPLFVVKHYNTTNDKHINDHDITVSKARVVSARVGSDEETINYMAHAMFKAYIDAGNKPEDMVINGTDKDSPIWRKLTELKNNPPAPARDLNANANATENIVSLIPKNAP